MAGGRLRGVDLARAVAVLGMVMIHIGRFERRLEGAETAYDLPYGRAFVLFVLLAGVGISLLAGDRSPVRLQRAIPSLLLRVGVLFLLGVWLQGLDTGVAVILHYYALYFLAAVLLLPLPDRWLLGLALVMAVVGPALHLAGQVAWPDAFAQGRRIDLTDSAVVARDLVLTGYYPVVTAVVPLILGMWIGRQDLRAERVRRELAAGGALVAAAAYLTAWGLRSVFGLPPIDDAGWLTLLDSQGHSEMPFSVIGATAIGCAVLGACLFLADRLPRLTWPLAAVGRMALTVYIGHLLVLHVKPDWLIGDTLTDALVSVARFLVVTALLAVMWFAVLPRGPLETLLHLPWWRPGHGRRATPGGA